MTPAVTVCVSTFQRADRLARLLEALAGQGVPGLEVVVYDDASTDGTAALLTRWQQSDRLDLTVLRGAANRGPAYGRNAAWRAARAPLVLFTDDDCVPAEGWAREHVAAAGPGRVTVGRTVPNPEQAANDGPFSRSLRMEDATRFETANVAYPRELLEELGGFDESFSRAAGEDTDLGFRALAAGAQAAFVPTALVHHDIRPSSWWAAMRETTKWVDVPLFAARHPGVTGTVLHSPRWWRRTHPVALLAAAGVIASPRWRLALLAVLPWVRLRTGDAPVHARRRHWAWVLPAQLAIDLAEVVTLARGSARHRRLLL
jgi:GT2 family glycosyltransferase